MKNNYIYTFYCYDGYRKAFIRLAVVESVGLCNILLPELKKTYSDNLYKVSGLGKREIKQQFTDDGFSKIILDRV